MFAPAGQQGAINNVVTIASASSNPYAVLPPAPSTNPYPYGKHSLFKPVGGGMEAVAAAPGSAGAAGALAPQLSSLFGSTALSTAGSATPLGTAFPSSGANAHSSLAPNVTSAVSGMTGGGGFHEYGLSSVLGGGVPAMRNASPRLSGMGARTPFRSVSNDVQSSPRDFPRTPLISILDEAASAGRMDKGGVVTPLNPLVAFRSPRALDIDVDKLTDRTAQPAVDAIDASDAEPAPHVATTAEAPLVSSTPSVLMQMTPATRPPSWARPAEGAQMTPQPLRASHPHGDHKRGEVPLHTLEELGRCSSLGVVRRKQCSSRSSDEAQQ